MNHPARGPGLLILIVFGLILSASVQLAIANSPPVVTEVWAQQLPDAGNIVYVHYKVHDTDGDPVTIRMYLSEDGGATFPILCTSVTGWVGPGIIPGDDSKAIWWDAVADYPGHSGDNYVVRVVADDGPAAAPELDWSYAASGAVRSVAILEDGTIYAASAPDRLVALNPDGSLKWETVLDTAYTWQFSSPAIGPDGTIYVGSDEGSFGAPPGGLFAVDPMGTLLWRFEADRDREFFYSSPIIAVDGTIYAASWISGDVPRLYAINPDGTRQWDFDAETSAEYFHDESTGAIGPDGTIYVTTGAKLYAVNPTSTTKWTYPGGVGNPVVGGDGAIYGWGTGGLLAFNTDGSVRWNFVPPDSSSVSGFLYAPAIGENGVIYAAYGERLYAVNPDGSLRWTSLKLMGYDPPNFAAEYFWFSPAITADGKIHVMKRYLKSGTREDGEIYTFNPDGTLAWVYTIASRDTTITFYTGDLTIGQDGTIYSVFSSSWVNPGYGTGTFVIAIGSTSPPATSAWPVFQHDAKHSGRFGGP